MPHGVGEVQPNLYLTMLTWHLGCIDDRYLHLWWWQCHKPNRFLWQFIAPCVRERFIFGLECGIWIVWQRHIQHTADFGIWMVPRCVSRTAVLKQIVAVYRLEDLPSSGTVSRSWLIRNL